MGNYINFLAVQKKLHESQGLLPLYLQRPPPEECGESMGFGSMLNNLDMIKEVGLRKSRSLNLEDDDRNQRTDEQR